MNPTPCIDTGINNYRKGGIDTKSKNANEKELWQLRVQIFFDEEYPVPKTTAIAHQRKKGKETMLDPVLSIKMKIRHYGARPRIPVRTP